MTEDLSPQIQDTLRSITAAIEAPDDQVREAARVFGVFFLQLCDMEVDPDRAFGLTAQFIHSTVTGIPWKAQST